MVKVQKKRVDNDVYILQVKPTLCQPHEDQNTIQKTSRPQIHQDLQENKKEGYKQKIIPFAGEKGRTEHH